MSNEPQKNIDFESYVNIRATPEDKEFLLNNKELHKYLILKHETLAQKQEEYVHLMRLELEESLNRHLEDADRMKQN